MEDFALYGYLLIGVSSVAWLGQWGRSQKVVRYVVLIMTALSGVALLLGGCALIFVKNIPNFPITITPKIIFIAWLFIVSGALALPSLIPIVRKGLAKTIFPGLEVDSPAHTWGLFMYFAALTLMLFSLTVLYDPATIIEALKSMPLVPMASLNALAFVLFAFVGAGFLIRRSFPQVLERLGIGKLPWKTVGLMVLIAVGLSLGIQLLEMGMMPFVPETVQKTLHDITSAMQITGGPVKTVFSGAVVGLGAGLGEEVVFRGLLQPVFGIIPTAILFACTHTHYGFTVLLIELFIVGSVLGLIRNRWNTTAAIIVHACFDFFSILSSLFPH